MAITVYPDVFLPPRVISSGVRGRQVRKNTRVAVDGGQESINIVWTQTMREYEVGFIPMNRLAWHDIETIHEVTEGGAYGFLLEDPKDARCERGVVQALTSTTFQLYKRYLDTASGRYKDRKITRPRSSGFLPLISGGSAGGYSLNVNTGVLTIGSAPDPTTVTWTGNFYVPVHFMDDHIDWQMVVPGTNPDSRYIAGPTVVLREIRE